jgi:hypothetical protein
MNYLLLMLLIVSCTSLPSLLHAQDSTTISIHVGISALSYEIEEDTSVDYAFSPRILLGCGIRLPNISEQISPRILLTIQDKGISYYNYRFSEEGNNGPDHILQLVIQPSLDYFFTEQLAAFVGVQLGISASKIFDWNPNYPLFDATVLGGVSYRLLSSFTLLGQYVFSPYAVNTYLIGSQEAKIRWRGFQFMTSYEF